MSGQQLFGAHVPNEQPVDLVGLLAVIGKTGPTTILDLNILRGDIPTGGGGRRWYQLLREDRPNAWIHVRLYDEHWQRVNPRERASRAVRELGFLLGDPYVTISAANEQDIEGWIINQQPFAKRPTSYEIIGRWQLDFWNQFWKEAPGAAIKSQFAALAGGHDMIEGVPDSEYTRGALREAVQACEILGVHCYSDLANMNDAVAFGPMIDYTLLKPWRPKGRKDQRDPGGVAVQFPHKPLFISECGSFLHSKPSENSRTLRVLQTLVMKAATRALGVTVFVWSSDQANWINAIQPYNPDLAMRLRGLSPLTVTAKLKGEQPPAPPAPIENLPPRVTEAVGAFAVAMPGEGKAAFAGRAAGHPQASYRQRLAWWLEIAAANNGADGLTAGRAYRIPWFKVEV